MEICNTTGITAADLKTVLRQLMSCSGLSANALAKHLDLPPPTVNRLITGEVQDPRLSTLTGIANYFGVSLDQLVGRLELEKPFKNTNSEIQLVARPPMSIPILTIAQAVNYQKFISAPDNWLPWQSQSTKQEDIKKDRIFAVAIRNNLYEPLFAQGSYLIVNPAITLSSGDYILLNFGNDPVSVIKKYVAEGNYKYLYSLKPDMKTIAYNVNECTILGVITELYMNFKD